MRYPLFIFGIFISSFLLGQAPTVHTYFDGLELDLYRAVDGAGEDLLIYVHGGGFSGGSRAEGKDYCTMLAAAGINWLLHYLYLIHAGAEGRLGL